MSCSVAVRPRTGPTQFGRTGPTKYDPHQGVAVPSPQQGGATMTMTTLIEDGSNMCEASGPAGMSDGVMAPHKHLKSESVLSAVGSGQSQETL